MELDEILWTHIKLNKIELKWMEIGNLVENGTNSTKIVVFWFRLKWVKIYKSVWNGWIRIKMRGNELNGLKWKKSDKNIWIQVKRNAWI